MQQTKVEMALWQLLEIIGNCPIRQLLVQNRQWKQQDNVWDLFKVYNE